jgi:flagellar biosynthetic protein FliP
VTFVSLLGILGTLGLVLGLFLVAARVLRSYTSGTMGGSGERIRLEVVQRLALGPKQGIAVVRIGDRTVAVSMGEGGVRHLMDIEEHEAAHAPPAFELPAGTPLPVRHAPAAVSVNAPVPVTVPVPAKAPAASPFPEFPPAVLAAVREAVSGVRRGSAAMVLVAALGLAALGATPGRALAQAPDPAAQAPAEVAAPMPAGGPIVAARVDTMMSRLGPQMDVRLGGGSGEGLRLSGTVGVVVMLGLLTMLPTLVLMMTGFTRILIVLHFLKQALGTQSAPPAHLVGAFALILTGFVMAPTFHELNTRALQPWMDGQMEQSEMMQEGVKPLRAFMLSQTRDSDIESFLSLADAAEPQTEDDIPLVVLVSAFVTSELRTAFQIGFALFLPFIVIDVVVASVLMSMGMFMLPPTMVALPFKLLLFVLVDGWTLVVQGMVESFR